MTNKEIKELVFKELNKLGYQPYNEKSYDGYFIIEAGEDSVWEFYIKGCRRWKFGLWVMQIADEDGKPAGEYKLYLFTQYEDWIDKFKPSCSLSYDITWKPSNETNVDADSNSKIDWLVWDFHYQFLSTIYHSPVLSRFYLFDHRLTENIVSEVVKDTFFYRVRKPIEEWYKRKAMTFILHMIAFMYKARFGFNNIDISVEERPDFYSPTHEFRIICKKDADEYVDTYRDIYFKAGLDRKPWLINTFDKQRYVHASLYETEHDYRGFYFNNDNN